MHASLMHASLMHASLRQAAVFALTGLGLAALAVAPAHAQVITTVYTGHSNSGSGAPFSGLVGTLNTPGITFLTDTGDNWHPFGLNDFGTDSTGLLDVAATGPETFSLNSDDGSALFIDGMQIISNPDVHAAQTVTGTVTLTAGLHPFEVQFFENGVGPSGLDLALPQGVTYAPAVPEASTTASFGLLLALGVGGILVARKRQQSA